jgi:DNA-binding response OmpR family regulator
MPRKILVVDDEKKVCELVRRYLEREGFEVLTVYDGKAALESAQRHHPDLVVLDLNLPEVDGLEVCRILRRQSSVPIIMLTARDEDADKLIGLELGADDYVTKPFSPRELVARVKAVLRRATPPLLPPEQVVLGNLVIDLTRHEARCHGALLDLTPTEFKLLHLLASNPGRVYTRSQLLDLVQGEAYEGYDRTIDAHIKNLRQKLASVASEEECRIITVRGVGYKLEGEGNA